MMLRTVRGRSDHPAQDAYEVVDTHSGERICWGSVEKQINQQMYPRRALRIAIRLSEQPNELLLGALLARSRQLAQESGLPGRIYACVAPEDDETMRLLRPYGFLGGDARVCMRYDIRDAAIVGHFPEDVRMRSDFMDRREDRAYFLERYNKIYGADRDLNWLDEYLDRDDFVRIQAVATESLAAEMLLWRQENTGVVGYIQTNMRWRRRGIAREMLKFGARYFAEGGIKDMAANVHLGIPGLAETFISAGYYQDEVLMRYPGFDVNLK